MPAAPKDGNDPVERSAILLLALGQDEAAEILKNLGPKEVQKLGHAMAALKQVPRERIEQVLDEFQGEAAKGAPVQVDEETIKAMLTKALGDDRAANLIGRILQEGDTFSEVPAFDEGTNPVNVEALETCRVWVINNQKLHELIMAHPVFAQKVLVNFGKMLRGMVRMVSEMAFYQVTHRLARLIAEMPQEKSAPHWTQEQLAARLGTVREVVARSMKELERSGAIKVEDRRIQIADQEIFSQWMQ